MPPLVLTVQPLLLIPQNRDGDSHSNSLSSHGLPSVPRRKQGASVSSSRAASQKRQGLPSVQCAAPHPAELRSRTLGCCFLLLNPHTATASHLAYSESKPLSLSPLPPSTALPPRSMGLVAADLISAVAASLYYFLVYNDITGSKQKDPSWPEEPTEGGGWCSGLSRSPSLRAVQASHRPAQAIRVCDSRRVQGAVGPSAPGPLLLITTQGTRVGRLPLPSAVGPRTGR